MYLVDTNVISEMRKQDKANPGVQAFFKQSIERNYPFYLSVITIGELRRGIELICHRNDLRQAALLENWLQQILADYSHKILNFTSVEAQIWGKLRVPHPENIIDKQIAAIALVNDLTLVTRDVKDFQSTGIKILNPFVC